MSWGNDRSGGGIGSCGPSSPSGRSCGPDDGSRGNRGRNGGDGGDGGGQAIARNPFDTGRNVSQVGNFADRTVEQSSNRDFVPVGQVSSSRLPGQSGSIQRGDETNGLDVIGKRWG